MKKFKAFISLVLSLVLVVALLSGCSGGAKTGEDNQGTKTESTVAPTSETQAETVAPTTSGTQAEEDIEPLDINLMWWYSPSYESTEDTRVKDAIEKKFFEDTGIKINFNIIAPTGTYLDELTKRIATGEPVDAVRMAPAWAQEYFVRGNLRAVDDLVDKYMPNFKTKIPQFAKDTFTVYGKLTGLCFQGAKSWFTWTIRKDIFEKNGLNTPQTYDELETAAAALKKAYPDSSPITTLVPDMIYVMIAGKCDLPNPVIQGASLQAGGLPNYYDEKSGQIKPVLFHENAKEFLETIQKWVKNGWLSKDFIAMTPDQHTSMVKSDKSFIHVNGWWFYTTGVYGEMKLDKPEVKVDVLFNLKNSRGNAALVANAGGSGAICIPKGVDEKKVEAIAKFYDWELADSKNYFLTHFGIEGTDYTIEDGKMIVPDKFNISKTPDAKPYIGKFHMYDGITPEYNPLTPASSEWDLKLIDYFANVDVVPNKAVDMLYVDMKDLMAVNEDAKTKALEILYDIVVGKRPVDDIEKAKDAYMKTGGDKLIEKMTQIYNDYYKK